MIKRGLLLLLSFLLLTLSGCAEFSGASAGKIIPPSNPVYPLVGKWMVLQASADDGNEDEATWQWVGSDVQFAADAVAFGGQIWDKPSYKIKRVNAADYLMMKSISSAGISLPNTEKVDVITVYAAANYLGEFMKLDDTNMIFFMQNKNLLLKKVADEADSTLSALDTNAQHPNQSLSEGLSGVLLGLRIPSGAGYTYQTLWIAVEGRQLHPVLAAERIFFPRASGFWELDVQDNSAEGETGNILAARNVAAKIPELKKGEAETSAQVFIDPAFRVVNYIGNDYVAIEKRTAGVKQLQMLPVDKLSSPTEIKVSDLLGDNGLNAYLSAREQVVAALSDKGVTSFNRDESGENFGLARKNGHWSFVGRIHYQSGGTFEYTDFDLKIIPPANLIFYDTLALNWHKIKDRVPDALDAFTSPNKDIALVKTKNKLTIYPIGAEQLEENPLAGLDLPEGTTVIMADWATGSYVDSWEKSFLAYGAQALADNSVRLR